MDLKGKEVQTANIAILIEKLDDIILGELIEVAQKVKLLKIVTDNVNRFSYMEKRLYSKFGIAIQITSNKKKSLKDVNVVVNFDFNEEKLKECNINNKIPIISVNAKIESNNWQNNIIDCYEISYNEELTTDIRAKSDFHSNILYESLRYKKDTFSRIKKQLEFDNVRLTGLFVGKEKVDTKILDKQKNIA